jgi:transcriptional regulator with XRE-family HTH domain
VGVEDDLRAVGRAIQRRRKERQLSQEALAELTGLHRNYVGQVERGERNVTTGTLISIARALGVSASVFFEGVR